MNKHLNIFKTYAKGNRSYQLENDLTRALAICLQEDALFFHEVLKTIIDDVGLYNQLFEDLDGETDIQIEIQKQTSKIEEFDKVFAVSLSESLMSEFWQQTHNSEYDPICDLVITINDILIVIEAKRDNIDCTAQLYNQILNIFNNQNKSIDDYKEAITPFDLNWRRLMAITVKVASFEKTTGNSNRFLTDFIQLVKGHNFSWLPETPIGSLKNISRNAIYRRVESALTEFCNNNADIEKLPYRDRLGTTFSKGWANELLFKIDADSGDLVIEIYPGNTKGQGYHIFYKEPQFNESLNINDDLYTTRKCYHIKIMGQSYITGLWLTDDDFSESLYTKKNFNKHTGRVKRANWGEVESLLDQHISSDWKSQCKWQDKIINSNRSQFNISFGYQISFRIPFQKLRLLDVNHNDITPLANLIESIYNAFEENLIKEAA
ncbi:hypothetical protein SIN8267_00119 [Sinobacterium norvegicum]|uniref:PD-(D/E)XK nuclease superfamily protein n=1 Tax=Sinobacterium norvegicum TaxID=1641715 RepID=A0ABM9ABR8_9GAMM|nr:hypothetical protein [Sinobacterium norvegicum]CAH0990036.1 hypothetical protein SIN8267_00119 [Sinobacterium norvegicum]